MNGLFLFCKIVATLWTMVLIPVYWIHHGGPGHFLWFSDVALFLLVAALWFKSSLLASMSAVGMLALELGWVVGFVVQGLLGVSLFGMTDYMFDPGEPLLIRGLSLFHLWLPPLIVWAAYRFGYDRRALPAQTVLALGLLLATFFLTDPEKNINWVFGPGGERRTWMPPWLYLLLQMIVLFVCVHIPSHFVLRALMPERRAAAKGT